MQIKQNAAEESYKILGIYLDEKLSWKDQIDYVANKINSGIYALSKCKLTCNEKVKLLVYDSLVMSHINYGLPIWGNANSSLTQRLVKLQKKAIRLVPEKYATHTEPLFKKYNRLNFGDQVAFSINKLGLEINKNISPTAMNALLTQAATRTNHPHKCTLPKAKLKNDKSQINNKLVEEWNTTTYIYRNLTLPQAKQRIKQDFLMKYRNIVRCNNKSCRECLSRLR